MLPKQHSRILIVDDESSVTGALALILGEKGYEVETASTFDEAIELINLLRFDLVFTDLRLPGATGIDLLTRIKENNYDAEVILMTAHGSLDVTIEVIKKGAYYYLEKPFTPDQLLMLAERALQFRAIKRENQTLKRSLSSENGAFGIVGRTPKMRHIYEIIQATAQSEASVLIEGESGTGKELIATAIYLQSDRANRPFIPINCAAIPRDLIESELFGYKRGAFTGADRDKRGLIEAASGGTIMLDEIAEMPAQLQIKLLRVLQERKLRRLGDERSLDVDFRLIAATNRITQDAMQDGSLREDLYFRISTIKIEVPPLRERLDDLPLLAEIFLSRYAEKYSKSITGMSPQVFHLLARYDWPGNVRELQSVIERGVLFCQGERLIPGNLPEHIRTARTESFRCEIPPYLTLEEIEREAIRQTLVRTSGNIKKTAEILKLHRPTLYRKLKKFGLREESSVME